MGIERARVLEVDLGAGVHAGYLLGDRLVLTAGAGPLPGRVRPAGTVTWLDASTVWSSPAGATLLALDDPAALMMPPAPPPLGRVTGRRPVAVVAMGFPPAPTPPRWARDPERFSGSVVASGSAWLAVEGRPADSGMAGAALFAGAELVGVLVTGARAVAMGALAADPGFAGAMGGGPTLVLADVSTPATAFPIF